MVADIKRSHVMRGSIVALFLGVLLVGCMDTEESPEEHEATFYTNNAQAYYDGGHYERALQQFEKALEADSGNDLALVGRAWTLLMLGESQILRSQKSGAENLQLALEAFDDLEGRDFGPASYKIDLGLGRAHLQMAELYERRVERLERELARRPDEKKKETLAEAEESRKDEYELAEKFIGRVLQAEDNPLAKDDLTALLLMARVAVGGKDYPGALVYTERYLEQVRRSKNLWLDAIRRFPKDEALYEAKLAGAVNKEVPARYVISNALFKLGRFKEAEAELNEILLLAPHVAEAWLDRAILREQLGKTDEALADYREFLTHAAALGLTEDDARVREASNRIAEINKPPAPQGGSR